MPGLSKEKRIELLMRKTNKHGQIVREELGNCWEWTGSKKNGYGLYGRTTAHRMSYELFNGLITNNLFVMHLCDNRACLNPTHLKLGTNQENTQDKVEKGRAKGGNGHVGQNASYSKVNLEQVKEIRENPHDKCLGCLAKQFKISPQQVSRIQHNERWSELVETETEEQNFWKRAIHEKRIVIEPLGECWETVRDRMQFSYKNKHMLGHRIAYVITFGPVSQGHVIRHKCDNSKCINPAHLESGTHQENMKDRTVRGRTCRGVKHHSAKLTNEIALDIFNTKDTTSLGETAKKFGISKSSVSKIWKKTAWKHIHV